MYRNNLLICAVLLIFILGFFSSCNIEQCKSDQNNYQEKSYSVKNDTINYNVTYPQFIGEKYKEVNKLIEQCALETVNELDTYDLEETPNNLKVINEDFNISFFNDDMLSLSFKGYYNISTTAHPSYTLRALNYDIKNNKELKLADIVKINDDFIANVLKNLKDQSEPEVYQFLSEPLIGEFGNRIYPIDNENNDYKDSFNITENGAILNFETIYALGGFESVFIQSD